MNEKIVRRLKTLRSNIDNINSCYNDTLKDTFIECGLEYNKSYPMNEETFKLFKKHEDLEKLRVDNLFDSIFNFTQTYYSIKEYLCKEYPQHKGIIENFFSNEKIGLIARKDICNDLKHNPEKDLKYGFGMVSEETKVEAKKRTTIINYRRTWFYSGIDSVEHCNRIYDELVEFLDKNFK